MTTMNFETVDDMLEELDRLDLQDFGQENVRKIFAWIDACIDMFSEESPAPADVVQRILSRFAKYGVNTLKGETFWGRVYKDNIHQYACWLVRTMLGYLDDRGYIPPGLDGKIVYYYSVLGEQWKQARRMIKEQSKRSRIG